MRLILFPWSWPCQWNLSPYLLILFVWNILQTHTHMHTHKHTQTHINSFFLSLTHTCTRAHTHSLSLTHALTHTHTKTHKHTSTHSHTHKQNNTHTHNTNIHTNKFTHHTRTLTRIRTNTHTCDVFCWKRSSSKGLFTIYNYNSEKERKKDNQTNFTQYSRSSFKKILLKKKVFLLLSARSDLSQVKQNRRGILYPCSEKKKKNLRKFFLSNLSKNIFYDCWKWKEKKSQLFKFGRLIRSSLLIEKT